MRGVALAQSGQIAGAEACHRSATELSDGDRDEAFLNLGLVLRAQGRYAQATAAFQSALEITPDYAEAKEALRTMEGIEEAMRIARALSPCR